MSDKTENMRYVPALTIGGDATIKQRARNGALYHRLRDGDGTGDFSRTGLSGFVFEVPMSSVTFGGNTVDGMPDALTFRLDKDSDCFRRLLRVISDHFDAKCDADDRVAMLEDRVRALTDEVARLSAIQ